MLQSKAMVPDRAAVRDRFERMRARTRALFDLLTPEAYYARPIALRNPVVFYEGHLPAFAVNTLLKKGLGQPGIDAHLETIFARGIDPDEEANAIARGNPAWPARDVVTAYAEEADRRLLAAIDSADLDRDDNPLLKGAQALWTILEHEEMHQETLAYIWHEAPYAWKKKPEHYRTAPPRIAKASGLGAQASAMVRIPAGIATLGTDPTLDQFGWDNEFPQHQVSVPAFAIDAHNVTNGEYLEFMQATGAAAPHFLALGDAEGWCLRGMFERVPLPLAWPVYVTWEEASSFACWRGMRLPTEAEFHRAAYGTPDGRERRHPWGDEMPYRVPGNFDFNRWDPEPIGSHPDGASAFGVHDLVGNGWEWTGDVFAPFDGFKPMASYPEYSAEFFDGEHYVMKGASPMTARPLTRRGFRNWFRPRYPYVYATFRCVS
jgi:formylglycine-generating enzyme required for sulfatase activity